MGGRGRGRGASWLRGRALRPARPQPTVHGRLAGAFPRFPSRQEAQAACLPAAWSWGDSGEIRAESSPPAVPEGGPRPVCAPESNRPKVSFPPPSPPGAPPGPPQTERQGLEAWSGVGVGGRVQGPTGAVERRPARGTGRGGSRRLVFGPTTRGTPPRAVSVPRSGAHCGRAATSPPREPTQKPSRLSSCNHPRGVPVLVRVGICGGGGSRASNRAVRTSSTARPRLSTPPAPENWRWWSSL